MNNEILHQIMRLQCFVVLITIFEYLKRFDRIRHLIQQNAEITEQLTNR